MVEGWCFPGKTVYVIDRNRLKDAAGLYSKEMFFFLQGWLGGTPLEEVGLSRGARNYG